MQHLLIQITEFTVKILNVKYTKFQHYIHIINLIYNNFFTNKKFTLMNC
jgi:hypothetical protein